MRVPADDGSTTPEDVNRTIASFFERVVVSATEPFAVDLAQQIADADIALRPRNWALDMADMLARLPQQHYRNLFQATVAGLKLDTDPWLRTATEFARAAEATPEGRAALDEAVEELRIRQPSVSQDAARRAVLAYAYALSLALMMTVLLVHPVAAALLLAASGFGGAKDMSDAAGKAFDALTSGVWNEDD